MPPLDSVPLWAWSVLGAVLGLGLAWLGWRQGPGRRLEALEVEQDRLRRIVEGTDWGDNYLKTQQVRGLFGKRTTLDVGKKGPF